MTLEQELETQLSAALETGGGAARVLVVDDSPLFLDVVGEYLRRCGYQIEVCVNGRDAIERLQQISFDVLVTDLSMQPVNGLELCAYAHQHCPQMK